MARDVDPKRTRKALRIVRRLAARGTEAAPSEETDDTSYSGWEREFLTEVEGRLTKYGSAFANLSKGRPDEALSTLQAQKLREIAAKAAGKPRKGMTTRKPLQAKRPAKAPMRDRNDD